MGFHLEDLRAKWLGRVGGCICEEVAPEAVDIYREQATTKQMQ